MLIWVSANPPPLVFLLTVILDKIMRTFQETITAISKMMSDQQDMAAELFSAVDLMKDEREALVRNQTEALQTSNDAFNVVMSRFVNMHKDLARVSHLRQNIVRR